MGLVLFFSDYSRSLASDYQNCELKEMNPFLKQVAEYTLQKFPSNLHRVCMVFPNRRAGVFYSEYLSQLIKKPVLSPRIVTINSLVSEFSDLKAADPLSLIFKLHRIFCQVTHKEETFDNFYFWGEMLVSDFDDVDKYLVQPADLFKNLASLKEIERLFDYLTDEQKEYIREFWGNIASIDHSENRDDFVSVWEVLLLIYEQFREELRQTGEGYEGMIYREMAEKINGGEFLDRPDDFYFFVGFNALNACERRLFSYMRDAGKAEFLWDYDSYYLNIPNHEAGLFLRENLKQFPLPVDFETESHFSDKEIEVIAVPSSTGQAQVVAQQLSQSYAENRKNGKENLDFDRTAVVLGEEDLLIPVLSAMPSVVDKVNITMGYPLKVTPVYGFIMELSALQKEVRLDTVGNPLFYYRNVLSVLQHRLVKEIAREDSDRLVDDMIRHNRTYLAPADLQKNPFLLLLFQYHESPLELSDYMLAVLKELFLRYPDKEGNDFGKESVYQLYLSVNRLSDELRKEVPGDNRRELLGRETWFRLLSRYLGRVNIPFEGEPVSGMQVMGILETRCLDFDTVFILSVSEGVMPASGGTHSFIPYQLRRGFGLPTMEQQDAMYAYYFYRLLQRAKRVVLLYNPVPTGITSGEMSRYIYQLRFDSKLNIREKSLGFDIAGQRNYPISIRKDKTMTKQMMEYFSHHKLSPSALNTYLDCGLKFYFHYVAGLEESQEVQADIDAAVFGKIFHFSMEHLYRPFVGKIIHREELTSMLKNDVILDRVLREAFKKEFFNQKESDLMREEDITGRNRLIFSILKKSIKQVLQQDVSLTPFEVISLETSYEIRYPLEVSNQKTELLLGGFIDRVDRVNGSIRIIDYKTGKDKLDFQDIASLFDAGQTLRRKAIFQIMLYGIIFGENFKKEQSIGAGIYQIRDVFGDAFNPLVHSRSIDTVNMADPQQSTEFKERLTPLLSEIFAEGTFFDQVDSSLNHCSYCPYAGICHRD